MSHCLLRQGCYLFQERSSSPPLCQRQTPSSPPLCQRQTSSRSLRICLNTSCSLLQFEKDDILKSNQSNKRVCVWCQLLAKFQTPFTESTDPWLLVSFIFQTTLFKDVSSFFYSESSLTEDFSNKLTTFHTPLKFRWMQINAFSQLEFISLDHFRRPQGGTIIFFCNIGFSLCGKTRTTACVLQIQTLSCLSL